jgi:hypothetical protein
MRFHGEVSFLLEAWIVLCAAQRAAQKPDDIKEAGFPPVNAMDAASQPIGRIPPLSIAK